MISHKYRCIAVHQRKAAGTSIKALFDDVAPGSPERERFNEGILDPAWREDDALIRAYFKFAVIRNPYDRFVSGWKYCRSTRRRSLSDTLRFPPQENLLRNVFALRASLGARRHSAAEHVHRTRERLRYALGYKRRDGTEWDTPPVNAGHDYRHVTRPQWVSIYHPDGRLAVDRIFYLEDLQKDLKDFCRQTGVIASALPAANINRQSDDYRRYFDDRSLALFNRRFETELAYFPYDFQTGTRRDR